LAEVVSATADQIGITQHGQANGADKLVRRAVNELIIIAFTLFR